MLFTSLHYRLWRGLSAGAGTGIEIYEEAYLPVFAHAMYTFGDGRRVSPFVSLQGGYEIPLGHAGLFARESRCVAT